MLTDRERFAKGWGSGKGDGTVCGAGSTIMATSRIRRWLPGMVERHGIRTVCDAGAGDLHWIKLVPWQVEYRPFDLIVRHPSVTELDIVTQPLPACDLILCRAVLNHLHAPQVGLALGLFAQAGKYLLATQFEIQNLTPGDFVNYDLRAFGLGEPLESCPDHPGELALWKL